MSGRVQSIRTAASVGIAMMVCASSSIGIAQAPPRTAGAGVVNSVRLHPSPAFASRAVGIGGFTVQGFGPHGAPVVGAPYSGIGTTESVTNLPDGNRIVNTNVTRYFRDSQGRTRTEHVVSPPAGADIEVSEHGMASIDDPVSGEQYMLHSYDKSVTVLPRPPMAYATQPADQASGAPAPAVQLALPGMSFGFGPDPSAPQPISLGEQVIEGLRVTGTKLEHTIPAGQIGNERPITVTVEQWYSPELGVVVLSAQRSAIGTEVTYRLTQVVRGEPDPALFAVPADYTRREASFFRSFEAVKQLPAEER